MENTDRLNFLKEKFDKTAKVVDENVRKAADFAQDKFEEFKNNPKVQETLEQAKNTAADLASKGTEAFKSLFKKKD